MAVLTVNELVEAGVAAASGFSNAASGGDLVPNGGGDAFLLVKNAGSGAMTVTCPAQKTSVEREGFGTLTAGDITVSVPAGATMTVGPWGRARFNDGNGRVVVQYTTVTSVTVKAFRCPRR